MANGEVFRFNIVKPLWRLNRSVNGWQKEVNMVSWNGAKPKLDIREWNSDKTLMRKGMTFTRDEMSELKKCMANIDPDDMFDTGADDELKNKEPGPAVTEYFRSSTGNEISAESDEEEVSVCGHDK